MTAPSSRKTALVIVFGLFLISVLARFPTLNRPLSDHHEYNTAVILVGLESWQQAGGAAQFHFTPLLNYQDTGDKWYDSTLADSKGNTVYITFGPGWYIFPWAVMKLLNVQPSPLFLQILNLLLHLFSCIVLFRVAEILFKKNSTVNYIPVLITCFVFLFNPELLWFMGNGYVTTGVALPFLLMAILCTANFLEQPKSITPFSLVVLFCSLGTAIYCDWGGIFFAGMLFLTGLYLGRKNLLYYWLAIVSLLAVIFIMGAMFLQFSSWLGTERTLSILYDRFLYRSYGTDNRGMGRLFGWSGSFILTRYFPMLVIILAALLQLRINKWSLSFSKTSQSLLLILTASFVLQNLLLLNWTAGHDFSVINYSIIFSLLAGTLVYQAFPEKKLLILVLGSFLLVSIAEYFYFNPVGKVTRKGEPYDFYETLGLQVNQLVKPGERIFMNVEDWPQITYYAKRGHQPCASLEEAMALAQKNNILNFIWIEQRNGTIIQFKRFPAK